MPDYAVIIPAFNEATQLPATLDVLHSAMHAPAGRGEVIVVDNGSTDETALIARRAGARVVLEDHRQIARARNAGAAATEAPFLIFLDADTQLSPAVLTAAILLLQSGQIAGGGATLAFDRPLPVFGRVCLQLWGLLSRQFRWAAGSFFFVRRDAFEAVGGFSQRVYAGEEIYLSRAVQRWARRNKMKMRIIPSPPIVTSGRKFDWYPAWKVAFVHLILGALPFLVFSRRFCAFWYERPETEN